MRGWIILLGMFMIIVASFGLRADPALSTNAPPPFLLEFLEGPTASPEGAKLVFILVVIALATLITEDVTCVVTGILIANGTLTWTQGLVACLSGIIFGDFLLFIVGRKLGRPALKKFPLSWMINPVKLSESEEWFQRRGGVTIVIARVIPGTRLPAYVAAGLLGVSFLKFTFFFVLAAVIWTPALIWLAVQLAEKMLYWVERYHYVAPWILVGIVFLYFTVLHLAIPALHWRGRRKLYGRWCRLIRPEYWPTPMLYLPVFCDLAVRWLRPGKHPMDFSTCNPCVPGGGMVEESKMEILDQMGDRDAVAIYVRLSREKSLNEKKDLIQTFMQENHLTYPLVIKPDKGQRGSQVVIVKNIEDLEKALSHPTGDLMAQAFAPGIEFGVFYIREPADMMGTIFAITRKTFSSVTGDGRLNLGDLILKDNRAVCQASMHFRHLAERLLEVPVAGEVVQLTDVGNHCLGTLFEDGISLLTPELENRIDEISKSLPSFYFGRYDLIAPTESAFQKGEDLKVIELNGVSSEATSIYNPGNSYVSMVRTLRKQWVIASEIGLELQKQGHPRTALRQLIKQVDLHLERGNRVKVRLHRNSIKEG